MVHRPKVHDLAMVEGDQCLWTRSMQSLQTAHCLKCTLPTGLKLKEKTQCWAQCWIGWRHRSRQIWRYFWQNMPPVKKVTWSYIIDQNFMIQQGALYLFLMSKGKTEDLLLFVAPKAHHVATLNGCHCDAGHQGHDQTLSLLWECFWWLGNGQPNAEIPEVPCTLLAAWQASCHKAPLHPIVSTAPMDLLHVDFMSIEMTMEPNRSPKVANILVFQNHFMKHVMAYVTPDQTAKTVDKFLYQG